jgi:hypothetical protein
MDEEIEMQPGGAFEGSTVPRHCDCCHVGSRRPGLRSLDQVVNNGRDRKVAVKAKAYRLALAVSMLALAVNALGAPRKW